MDASDSIPGSRWKQPRDLRSVQRAQHAE
jgi:hypothetical protein